MRYAEHVATTPQSEPLDSRQVENSAGGFSYAVDDWVRLDRFLILGTEGGSYYASERKLTRDNAASITRCLGLDPARTVARIAEISVSGRAPKNDPAIFALALAAAHTSPATRKLAFAQLNAVCRIGTHLFQFVEAVTQFRGWGRGLRDAVAGWYAGRRQDDLALQVAKYRQRGGWSHRDLLRLSHLNPGDLQPTLRWVVKGQLDESAPQLLQDFTKAQELKHPGGLAPLLGSGLTWEMLPTDLLALPETWRLLLPSMPYTAMIRNLARMTASGALQAMTPEVATVALKLADQAAIRKARVHPIQVLAACLTYVNGQGQRGSLTWKPITQVLDALDAAFYLAFGNVTPSGKRLRVALDVSGSMDGGMVAGVPGLTPRIASGAMAMLWAQTEPLVEFQAFSDHLVPVDIAQRKSLRDVCHALQQMPFGGTDCSLPIMDALKAKTERDAFIVLTDSETWAGGIHPTQALKQYRQTVCPAKLVVVGMVANQFSIADPADSGMMDVVGFDTASPQVIADFVQM